MVIVEFRRPRRDDEGEVIGAYAVARLTVNGDSRDLTGEEPGVVDFERQVVSLRDGQKLHYGDDPEEWTRSLIGSYRTPYLWAEVVEDDDPVDELVAEPMLLRERIAR